MRTVIGVFLISLACIANADNLDQIDSSGATQPRGATGDFRSAAEMSGSLNPSRRVRTQASFDHLTQRLATNRELVEARKSEVTTAEKEHVRTRKAVSEASLDLGAGFLRRAGRELYLDSKLLDNLHAIPADPDLDGADYLKDFWTGTNADTAKEIYEKARPHLAELQGLSLGDFQNRLDDAMLSRIQQMALSQLGDPNINPAQIETAERLTKLTSKGAPLRLSLREDLLARRIDHTFWNNQRKIARKIFEALRTELSEEVIMDRYGMTGTVFDKLWEKPMDRSFFTTLYDDARNIPALMEVLRGEEGKILRSFQEYRITFFQIHSEHVERTKKLEQKLVERAKARGKSFRAGRLLKEAMDEQDRLFAEIDKLNPKHIKIADLGEIDADLRKVREEALQRMANQSSFQRTVAQAEGLVQTLRTKAGKLLPGLLKGAGGASAGVFAGKMVYDGIQASKGSRKEVDLSGVAKTARNPSSTNQAR